MSLAIGDTLDNFARIKNIMVWIHQFKKKFY